MQSHIRKGHVYLAVTCHLHTWQNDQGLLRDCGEGRCQATLFSFFHTFHTLDTKISSLRFIFPSLTVKCCTFRMTKGLTPKIHMWCGVILNKLSF